MLVKYFIYLSAFFSALVPHGLNCSVACNSITISVPLGSEVLLPCTLLKSKKTEVAKWSQNSSLLVIKHNGTINFEDLRDGRVTVFPFLFSRGNFSILIHQFKTSDLGTYCCQLSHECQRVEINLSESKIQEVEVGGLSFPWYYIAAGLGCLVLLVIVSSLTYEFRRKWSKRKNNSYYVNSKHNQGNSGPENGVQTQNANDNEWDGAYEEIESSEEGGDYVNMHEEELDGQHEEEVQEDQEEVYVNTVMGEINSESENTCEHRASKDASTFPNHRTSTTIYENDQHNPNQITCDRTKPPKQAFRKIPTQNQQTNLGASYYANQSKKQKSCTDGQRSKDEQYQFRNPLYAERTATREK